MSTWFEGTEGQIDTWFETPAGWRVHGSGHLQGRGDVWIGDNRRVEEHMVGGIRWSEGFMVWGIRRSEGGDG